MYLNDVRKQMNNTEKLTAKYMLVTPYMMMKILASVNFLKQKYKPAVTTSDINNILKTVFFTDNEQNTTN